MAEQINDKSFLNHQLLEVLDDLSEIIKDKNADISLHYQPLRQLVDLLNKGANANLQNRRGETLLHLAAYSADPLYAVENKTPLEKTITFFKNAKDYLNMGYFYTLLGAKNLMSILVKGQTAEASSLNGRIKSLQFRIQKRKPRHVFLSVEKILSTYNPNPLIKDKRLNTPAMAMARKIRQPLRFETDKINLTAEQADYKMDELNILSAYETAYHSMQSAIAMKALMTLAALRDNEKAIKDLSPVISTAMRASRYNENGHDEKDAQFKTHIKAERLIHTIIKASNNLSGFAHKSYDVQSQNEG